MLTLDMVTNAMISTEQMKGLSVLEHGVSVNNKFKELYNYLYNDTELKSKWKLPDWLIENKEFIKEKLYSLDIINEYQIYHDCGKPYCLNIDEEGKRHFPNHADKSYEIWSQISDNEKVGKLILMDMDIHLLKHIGVEEFASKSQAITLLLTGLCELHANAEMFGGIDSTSFKIKYKNINKRGKAILIFLQTNI